jgi:AAA+ ATPase superfamily predicted ATPase
MDHFIGRVHELALLDGLLNRVTRGGRAGRPGRAILIRGRRRVGKSRLVEEFIDRAGVPYVFFTASGQPTIEAELRLFSEAVTESTLPDTALFRDQAPGTWDAALRLLARSLPDDQPSVLVLDEMPYLIRTDPGFEGTLQKVFDRELSRKPVLLIGIGSDLAMMEALNEYGRPFHQRATELVIPPLSPADVAEMLALPAAEAFDAYLVSGGLPLVLDEWPAGRTALEYVAEAVADPLSALLVSGERALAAEFPPDSQARLVLGAIGSGERTYSKIQRAAGGMPASSLNRALDLLAAKRIADVATPLSTRPSRQTRYSVGDPHLRFWLAFLGEHTAEIERGRGDLVVRRIKASWSSWRGAAIEPVIREALRRITDNLPGDTRAVGGYWTRTNDPEIDLVGADRAPTAQRISFAGSIKWRDSHSFDSRDLAELIVHRSQLPGADETTPLLIVSRAGIAVDGPVALLPEDLLAAWRGCLRWRGECPEADRTASAAPDAQGGPAGVSESMAGLGRADHREDVRETIRG